jgi:hypothetical protein
VQTGRICRHVGPYRRIPGDASGGLFAKGLKRAAIVFAVALVAAQLVRPRHAQSGTMPGPYPLLRPELATDVETIRAAARQAEAEAKLISNVPH